MHGIVGIWECDNGIVGIWECDSGCDNLKCILLENILK